MKHEIRTLIKNAPTRLLIIGLSSGTELGVWYIAPSEREGRYKESHEGFYGRLNVSDEAPFVDPDNIIFIRYDKIEYIRAVDKYFKKV